MAIANFVQHPHDTRLRLATTLASRRRIVEVFPRAPKRGSPVLQIDRREQPLAQIIDRLDREAASLCDRFDSLARAQIRARIRSVDMSRGERFTKLFRVTNPFRSQRTSIFIEVRYSRRDRLRMTDQ